MYIKFLPLHPPLQSHDSDLGAWHLVHSYMIAASHGHIITIFLTFPVGFPQAESKGKPAEKTTSSLGKSPPSDTSKPENAHNIQQPASLLVNYLGFTIPLGFPLTLVVGSWQKIVKRSSLINPQFSLNNGDCWHCYC